MCGGREGNSTSSSSCSSILFIFQDHYIQDDESSTVTFVPEEDRPSFGELENKKYKYSLETDTDIYTFQNNFDSRCSLQHLTNSHRNSKSTQPTLIVPFILNSKENERIFLSEQEILSWGDANEGFENLLSSKHGQSIFGAFLQKEFSCENLLFWMDCNKLKENTDPDQEMFNNFINLQPKREMYDKFL